MNALDSSASARNPSSGWLSALLRSPARIAVAGIVAYTLAQAAFLLIGCDWDLCGDEAEFWAWSRRLDWSYYARGPLIAPVIRLGVVVFGGLSEVLTGSDAAAVRMPGVLLAALSAWGLYRLAEEVTRDRWAGLITVVLLPAIPMFRVGGLLMTADTPLLCCWVWGAVWCYRAVVRNDARGWPIASALVAVGIWAKYTMLAFPASIGLFLLASRAHRGRLLRPGFWLLALGCVVGMAPIVYWNVQNDWAAASQMSARLGLSTSFNWGLPLPLLTFLAGDFAAIGFWWPLELWVLGTRLPRVVATVRGDADAADPEAVGALYLVCLWLVIITACVSVSLMGETEANWSAPAHLALVVMLGQALGPRALGTPTFRSWFTRVKPCAAYWALAFVGLSALQHTELFYPPLARILPRSTPESPAPLRKLDPTCRLRGYRELAPEVAARFEALRAQGAEPFVLAPTYTLASSLAFAMPGQPEVYCLGWSPGMAARALNQHDLWHPNPRHDLDAFANRPAVIVEDAGLPPGYAQGITNLGLFTEAGPTERVLVRRNGQVVGAWDITVCRGYIGPRDAEAMRALFAVYTSDQYFKKHGGTIPRYVDGLFRDLFHRAPTAEETRFFSGVLTQQPREIVVERLARISGAVAQARGAGAPVRR